MSQNMCKLVSILALMVPKAKSQWNFRTAFQIPKIQVCGKQMHLRFKCFILTLKIHLIHLQF